MRSRHCHILMAAWSPLLSFLASSIPFVRWADAIAKELKDVHVAFKILLDGQSAHIGYQKVPCHMIFDVKMEDFRC